MKTHHSHTLTRLAVILFSGAMTTSFSGFLSIASFGGLATNSSRSTVGSDLGAESTFLSSTGANKKTKSKLTEAQCDRLKPYSDALLTDKTTFDVSQCDICLELNIASPASKDLSEIRKVVIGAEYQFNCVDNKPITEKPASIVTEVEEFLKAGKEDCGDFKDNRDNEGRMEIASCQLDVLLDAMALEGTDTEDRADKAKLSKMFLDFFSRAKGPIKSLLASQLNNSALTDMGDDLFTARSEGESDLFAEGATDLWSKIADIRASGMDNTNLSAVSRAAGQLTREILTDYTLKHKQTEQNFIAMRKSYMDVMAKPNATDTEKAQAGALLDKAYSDYQLTATSYQSATQIMREGYLYSDAALEVSVDEALNKDFEAASKSAEAQIVTPPSRSLVEMTDTMSDSSLAGIHQRGVEEDLADRWKNLFGILPPTVTFKIDQTPTVIPTVTQSEISKAIALIQDDANILRINPTGGSRTEVQLGSPTN